MQISSVVPAYTVAKSIQVTIDLSVLLPSVSKNVETLINNSLLKRKMLHTFLIINIGLGKSVHRWSSDCLKILSMYIVLWMLVNKQCRYLWLYPRPLIGCGMLDRACLLHKKSAWCGWCFFSSSHHYFENIEFRWFWRASHPLHIFLMLVCLSDLFLGVPFFSCSPMTNQMMLSQVLLYMQMIHCIFKDNTACVW